MKMHNLKLPDFYFLFFFYFFYINEFTIYGAYFDAITGMPSSIMVCFFSIIGIAVTFLKKTNIENFNIKSNYFFPSILFLIALAFDAFINIPVSLNYFFFFLKYFFVLGYLLLFFLINNNYIFITSLTILTKIYITLGICSFILIILSHFGISIQESDVSFLKKQNEVSSGLYYFPGSIGLILIGDLQNVFGFVFPRFSGLHIEPALFMVYFGMLIIYSWNVLNLHYKLGAIFLVLWSHSFSALGGLLACFLLGTMILKIRKWKKLFVFLICVFVVSCLILSPSITPNEISILKKLGSRSKEITLDLYKTGISITGRGFNVKPGIVDIEQDIHILSLLAWFLYIFSLMFVFFKNRFDPRFYYLLFFLIICLKSPFHLYPNFLPIMFLIALYKR